MDRGFLKRMNAQKLQSSVKGSGQLQLLVDDGHHQVNTDRNPDLCLHRIGARPIVMLDPQVPFDRAKEQLDSPPKSVNLCRGESRSVQVVGQENKVPTVLLVLIAHLAQERGIILPRLGLSRLHDLVAAQAGSHVHLLRPLPGKLKVVIGSSHKEGSGVSNPVHALEIDVATIHDIERSRLEDQVVEPQNVVSAGSCDKNAGGNRLPKALVVAVSRSGIEAVGDVLKFLTSRQLSKGHANELLPTTKCRTRDSAS